MCEDALVLADNLRQGNVCSPAVEPPEGADEQTIPLSFLGRRV